MMFWFVCTLWRVEKDGGGAEGEEAEAPGKGENSMTPGRTWRKVAVGGIKTLKTAVVRAA